MSCSVTSLASSSAAYRQAGRSRCSPHSSYSVAKFALNAFATGAFVCALTSCANDSYCSFRPANAFAASIAILPSSPLTLPSASEMEPEGTATNTTSASEPSPPSRPSAVTSCPACSHSRASPAPTLPLPMTTMFRVRTLPPPSMPHPASRLTRRRGAQTRPSGLPARRVPAWRRPLAVSGEPLPVRNRVAARAVREACRSGTVAAYRVQLEAAAAVRCEHDLGAVGRPRRVPVVRGVPRQVRWTPPLAVHDEDVVAAVPIAREGQTVPARGPRRVEVGGCALIRDVLLAAPVRIHHVDLRVSVAARLEGDSIAARRPRRHRVDAGGTREPAHVAAVGVHRVDLEVPVAAIDLPDSPSRRRQRLSPFASVPNPASTPQHPHHGDRTPSRSRPCPAAATAAREEPFGLPSVRRRGRFATRPGKPNRVRATRRRHPRLRSPEGGHHRCHRGGARDRRRGAPRRGRALRPHSRRAPRCEQGLVPRLHSRG